QIPNSICSLSNLIHLDLKSANFGTNVPFHLGNLSSLQYLDLSWNNFNNPENLIWLLNFNTSVVKLDLRFNQFHGLIPDGFSKMKSLTHLFLDYNEFEGGIPKTFSGLCNLNTLSLPVNNLNGQLLEFFHNLTGCANQSIEVLNLDWNQIMGSLPDLTTFPSLRELGLHHNHLNGTILDNLGKQSRLERLYLGHNSFEGFISEAHFSELTKLKYLDLFNTSLVFNFSSDWVPPFQLPALFLCTTNNRNLSILHLSNNQLLGELPNCWMHFEGLKILNLANNRFHGKIPNSIGSLLGIELLDLGNNSFTGELPSSLKNCTKLKFVNLRDNKLSGQIPMWLGSSHPDLVVLFLGSNHLFGSIPSHLCHLTHLQLLDLALNHISGSIPKCLNSLTSLTSPISTIGHLYKGRDLSSNLGQIKSIDLSSNKLIGPIPREIIEFVGLISLNLSRNLLTGRITTEIGVLRSLEVLDLSENQLSGGIPSSIALINSLNFLDLSNNNLSGIIPTDPQLNTFNATAYEGNPNLCGFPLPKKCPGETTQNPTVNRGGDHAGIQEMEDGFITPRFYVSVALGFVIGFGGVFGTLLLNRSW
ncbi:hypothetical protein ACB092_05G291400, partial [Castanea dentata]